MNLISFIIIDGNRIIDQCNGPNTAVGKVFRAVNQGQILDVLTKHNVYNVCYCRGKSCHPGIKCQFKKINPFN